MSRMRIFGTTPIPGTAGDDDLDGTVGDDVFSLTQGGNDTARGLGGNDLFLMGATFTADDRIRGGAGVDGIDLHGATNQNFLPGTISGIEYFTLFPGFFYRLSFDDANVAAGARLAVDGHNLGATDILVFVGIFETDGAFDVTGGAGEDSISMGAGDDVVDAGAGDDTISPGLGKDVVNGGAGSDFISFEGGFDRSDRIDGGDTTEQNTLYIFQDGLSDGFAFKASTMVNITRLELDGTNKSYDVDLTNATLRDGGTLSVVGHGDEQNFLKVDGSAVDNAFLDLQGGDGKDVLKGGGFGNVFDGNNGADTLEAGKALDLFSYEEVVESTGRNFDTLVGFDAAEDRIFAGFVVGDVDVVDPKVNHGTLSKATFNPDLEAAVDAGKLAEDHAVLFAPDEGTFAGKLFLIVDGNGEAGYQGSEDLVILLKSPRHMSDFDDTVFDVG